MLFCCISENISNFAHQMCSLEELKIDLKDLKEGVSTFSFDLGDVWFESLEEGEIKRGKVCASIDVDRKDNYFNLDFHVEGSVTVPCDRCLDDMDQPIVNDQHIVAKFGEEYSEDDDIITVPEKEGMLDTSWLIYQFIELAVPLRHVHAPGKCNPAMMKILEEHSAARSGDGEDEKAVDSRWAALSQIKINN